MQPSMGTLNSPSSILGLVNLHLIERIVLFFFLKVNLDLETTNQLGESSPKFIFAAVNRDPIFVMERR